MDTIIDLTQSVICLSVDNYHTKEEMLLRVEEWINDSSRSEELKKTLISRAQEKIKRHYHNISEEIYLIINEDRVTEQIN